MPYRHRFAAAAAAASLALAASAVGCNYDDVRGYKAMPDPKARQLDGKEAGKDRPTNEKLAGRLDYQEVLDNHPGYIELPDQSNLEPVDFRSTLTVVPNNAALTELVPDPLTSEERRFASAFERLIREMARGKKESSRAPAPVNDDGLLGAVDETIRALRALRGGDGGDPRSPAGAADIFDRQRAAGDPFDAPRWEQFVLNASDRYRGVRRTEHAGRTGAKLSVEAWLLRAGERIRLHVDGYDTYPQPLGQPRPRLPHTEGQPQTTTTGGTRGADGTRRTDADVLEDLDTLLGAADGSGGVRSGGGGGGGAAGNDPPADPADPRAAERAAARDALTASPAVTRALTEVRETTEETGQRTPHDVEVAEDGIIDLSEIVPRRGEVVEVRTTLQAPAPAEGQRFDRGGNAGAPPMTTVGDTRVTFRVEQYGLVGDYSANVIFVNRRQDDEEDVDKDDFLPAASASYTVRYRPRPGEWGEGAEGLQNIWSFLDPGLGLNVAVLPFDDQTELGVGGQVSFFDNLLHVGVGYSLTSEDDNVYYYVGIGILETLAKFGDLTAATRAELTK